MTVSCEQCLQKRSGPPQVHRDVRHSTSLSANLQFPLFCWPTSVRDIKNDPVHAYTPQNLWAVLKLSWNSLLAGASELVPYSITS